MAFQAAALLIGLREGLEALLVLGILLGMLNRFQARDKRPLVWAGFAAGIVASIIVGILIDAYLATWFEEQGGGALFEVVVALAAVVVLSTMLVWMQRNAKAVTEGLQSKVKDALAGGRGWILASLAFVTVLREGVETVLFFSALSTQATWGALILAGTIGFAISAAIAYAIFAMSVRVDLRRFFAITGVLIIFIAAGLLVHTIHAAADLGWIGHDEPLWDTSSTLPDEDHWLGGPLHALIGYEDRPTALQLLAYLAYLVGFGGWYLATLSAPKRRPAARTTTATAILLLLGSFAIAGAIPQGGDDHDALAAHTGHATFDHKLLTADARDLLEEQDLRVGLLVRSHGEPQHYNATTYEEFKEFIRNIWGYMGLPPELLEVDDGTYYIDQAHPFSRQVHPDQELVDAWLGDWDLPAVPVTDPFGATPAAGIAEGTYYFTPGAGAGLGEGDLFEIFGLGAYRTWIKMENHSPMAGQTEAHFAWLEKHIANHFGDRVVPAFAYHINPHLGVERSLEAAAQRLADMDVILDAYHSSIHSDVMNSCMMRPAAEHALKAAGFTGQIIPVPMAGTHPAWGEGVADYVQSRLATTDNVSVHLVQHGATPDMQNPCGSGEDQYMANTEAQFQVAADAITARFPGLTVRHVYGQGAGGQDDGFLSPTEALRLDQEAGVQKSILIPYEFWSDAMDALVPLRENLGFTPEDAPYYDADHETHLTWHGTAVEIWSADSGLENKGTAILARVSQALETIQAVP